MVVVLIARFVAVLRSLVGFIASLKNGLGSASANAGINMVWVIYGPDAQPPK